jgi:hypothetical protein
MNPNSWQAPKAQYSYRPIGAVFGTAALVAIATSSSWNGFMGFSLCMLATLKLMDIEEFASSFRKYDLVTKRCKLYGKVYPFLELSIGLGLLSGIAPVLTGAGALLVGLSGVVSVLKAVYVDRKSLHCACLGGNSKAPLGVISMLENTMMVVMGAMLLKSIAGS